MDARPDADRDTRRDDKEALEEIRRLFARYRRGARLRHGQVTERGEPDEVRAEEADDAAALTRR